MLHVVSIMFKQLLRLSFLCMVFVAGVLVGGINTSKAISYANQMIDYKNVEQQDLKKKTKPLKKKYRNRVRVV